MAAFAQTGVLLHVISQEAEPFPPWWKIVAFPLPAISSWPRKPVQKKRDFVATIEM